MELKEKIYQEILRLCEMGDSLVEESNYEEAVEKYLEALELVPEPKNIWETSTWIYTALGDTYFIKGDYQKAKKFLYDAINCPDGAHNPFVLMRLGQSLLELKNIEKAKEYLLKAYIIEGYTMFQDEDNKYFNLIIDII